MEYTCLHCMYPHLNVINKGGLKEYTHFLRDYITVCQVHNNNNNKIIWRR